MDVMGTYDAYLVALSFAVASFASYTALDLGGRHSRVVRLAQVTWLATAAIAMGGGIWSMHFIGMLAFFAADVGELRSRAHRLSLVVAIAVTGIGFYVIGTRTATRRSWL